MKNHLGRSFALVSLITCVSGPVFAASDEAPAQAVVERPEAAVVAKPAPESKSDAQTYAAREQSSQSLDTFRGGHSGIYIGGSALTVALLIVLLIVIL